MTVFTNPHERIEQLMLRIESLEAHIERWVFVTALQTFEDRERFRTESEKLLYQQTSPGGK
jgi:hypothetical protein